MRDGIEVNYTEAINANETFYARSGRPLERGQPTGWDIVVDDRLDGRPAHPARLGGDRSTTASMPNYPANLAATIYKGRRSIRTRRSHAPWQSGMTGLGYDTESTGELTSLSRRSADTSQGQGRLPRTRCATRSGSALLSSASTRPRSPTDAVRQAVAKAQAASRTGMVRTITGNDYCEDLVAATRCWRWPGPATSISGRPEADPGFHVPDEGGMLWTDNMLIPKGAANKNRPSCSSTSTTTRASPPRSRTTSTTSVRSRAPRRRSWRSTRTTPTIR